MYGFRSVTVIPAALLEISYMFLYAPAFLSNDEFPRFFIIYIKHIIYSPDIKVTELHLLSAVQPFLVPDDQVIGDFLV